MDGESGYAAFGFEYAEIKFNGNLHDGDMLV